MLQVFLLSKISEKIFKNGKFLTENVKKEKMESKLPEDFIFHFTKSKFLKWTFVVLNIFSNITAVISVVTFIYDLLR